MAHASLRSFTQAPFERIQYPQQIRPLFTDRKTWTPFPPSEFLEFALGSPNDRAKKTEPPKPASRKANQPRFVERAKWLKNQLTMRGWNEYDLPESGGPDHKTTRGRIFCAFAVGDHVLEKVVAALNDKLVDRHGKTLAAVDLRHIPSN